MSISPVSSSAPTLTQLASAASASSTARAADGDYKTSGAGHRVKDADGDYKATPAVAPTATTVSSSTQAAITTLKRGG